MRADQRLQCPWTPPAITRLLVERAAYERAGRPVAVIAEVARRMKKGVAP